MLSLYLRMKELAMNVSEEAGRTKKPAGRIIRMALLLVFSVGLLVGLYQCFHILHVNKTALDAYTKLSTDILGTDTAGEKVTEKGSSDLSETESGDSGEKRRQSIDFTELQKLYPEIVAWISAPEIGIDYPIMQTDNNTFYLTHLYDGSKNTNGAVFMDCNNAGSFWDTNTVIYGHNMKNGAMFCPLEKYKSPDFYDICPTMLLYTPEGDYLVELVSGTVEDGNYAFVKFNFDRPDELVGYIEQLKARSTFKSEVEVCPNDRILSMCTCTYGRRDNERYMLVGKLTGLYEP